MSQPRKIPSDSRLNLLSQPSNNPIRLVYETARRLDNLIFLLIQPKDQGSIPSVPQGVQALYQPNGTIRIKWQPCPDPDIAYYNIYRATDNVGTGAKLIGHKSHAAGADDRRVYYDWANNQGLTNLFFAVEAIDDETLSSGYSEWVAPSNDPDTTGQSVTYDVGSGYSGSFGVMTQNIGLLNGSTWYKYYVEMTGSASWTMVLNGSTIASGSGSASGNLSSAQTFAANSKFQFNITSGTGSDLWFGAGV